MDFSQANTATQVNTPKSYKSRSKATSPYQARRGSSGMTIQDSHFYQSNMSSPSRNPFAFSAAENDSFKVFVRVRPLDSKEVVSTHSKDRVNIIKVEDSTLFVMNPYLGSEWTNKPEKTYSFNKVFDQDVKTAKLYEETVSASIDNIISGYNSTILAYGMTGAGKTFTMFGDIANIKGGPTVHPGIVSLIVKDLFSAFERESDKGFAFSIKFSYLEIYNEHVRDLLTPSTEDLMVIEDNEKGVAIPNLSEFQINSLDDVLKLILQGNSRRVMASTHANQFSSRSHAIIQLLIEKRSKTKDTVESLVQSKLCLVDLAGSERAAVSENKGLRHREGANINRSLLALGNCINILSDPNKKGAFVPYRDSKLTRLLKESLGGNTQTVMLACVSPSYLAYEETVNTLKYALRARNIQRKVVQNVKEVDLHVSEYKEIIESLRAEVNFLKGKLSQKDEYGEGTVQPKLTSEYINKMNVALDDLGRKLVQIFEDHWEFTQSSNELNQLKAQNEEILKSKVHQLGKAAGDTQLYNKITKEISALKEVMANNEKIQEEVELNLERADEEKKLVQHQILGMISQSCQDSEEVQREICLEEIARGSPLLNDESPTFRKILHIPEEDETFGRSMEKDNKMQELLDEVEEMKRQLAEKDKLLIQNQKIIQFFLQSGTKPESLKPSNSLKHIPNCSPFKDKVMIDHDVTRWVELSHQEQDLKAADTTSMINRVPTTAQMTSLSKINTHTGNRLVSPKSLEQISALLLNQTASSASLSKRSENNYLHQCSSTSSIEEFRAYTTILNNYNSISTPVQNISSEEKISNNQPAQSKIQKSDQDKTSSSSLQVATSAFPDPPIIKGSVSQRFHYKSLSNNLLYSREAKTTNDIQKTPTSSQIQIQQQILNRRNTGGDLSSTISPANDFSGESFAKDPLLDNYSSVGKLGKASTKSNNLHHDKENLYKKATSPKSSFSTSIAYSHKISSQKSPSSAKHISIMKSKFYEVSSPEAVHSRLFESSRNVGSPVSLLSKTKSPAHASPSPDKPIAYKSAKKVPVQSPNANVKKVTKENKLSKCGVFAGLRVKVSPEKKPLGESMANRSNIETNDKKQKNEGDPVVSPFLQSDKNTPKTAKNGEQKDKKSSVSIFSTDSLQLKNEIKRFDTRRDLVKGFRTRLHQLANYVSYNQLPHNQIRDITALLEEYRANTHAYPLSVGDSTALKKLESTLSNQQNFIGEISQDDSEFIRTKESCEHLSDISDFEGLAKPYESLKKYERSPNLIFSKNSDVVKRALSADKNNLFTEEPSRTGYERREEQQMSTQNESSLGTHEFAGPATMRAKEKGNNETNHKIKTQQISKNFKLIRDTRKR